MYDSPKNKQELFALLDNDFNTALDINEQNNVWMAGINQSLETNLRLAERIGNDHLLLLSEYIKDRAKRGLKADYD